MMESPFVAIEWNILNSPAYRELPPSAAKALPYSSPLQFGHTSRISVPSKLEKILHGVQLDAKWYSDLVGGTLLDGMKSVAAGDINTMKGIFVSHKELLHVRNKTDDILVVYINEAGG